MVCLPLLNETGSSNRNACPGILEMIAKSTVGDSLLSTAVNPSVNGSVVAVGMLLVTLQ